MSLVRGRLALVLLFGPCVAWNGLGCGDDSPSAAETIPSVADQAAGGGGAGGRPSAPEPGPPIVDLRADVNRDGEVRLDDPGDDADEETWDRAHGAIFLANIDDDEDRCSTTTSAGKPVSDEALADCNDASDLVVNGADDEDDLAPLRIAAWPNAPDDATGRVTLTAADQKRARLFIRRNGALEHLPSDAPISALELRAGVELALEGRDIIRDVARWNGELVLTFTVDGASRDGGPVTFGTDTVRLRLAPVISHHHLEPTVKAFVSNSGDKTSKNFQKALAVAASAAGVPEGVEAIETDDIWTQDFFETAYMSRPAKGGPHVVRVALRSANLYGNTAALPLRSAGRVAFSAFRTKDFAGVQQFDPAADPDMDSLNSTGNFETIPPYEHAGVAHRLGRILRGSVPSFHPDRSFAAMLDAQVVQAPLLVDTSWLLVGHVDETMSFVKTATPRGWKLLVNDPTLARKMLEAARDQGHGEAPMFTGKHWPTNAGSRPAEVTIQQVLDDVDVMATSAAVAISIDEQLAIVQAEVGLTEDEIIRVPFLHQSVDDLAVAYQPGMVNGIYLSDTHFAAPKPFGPVIDGEDIFERSLQGSLGKEGIEVTFLDDWSLYHVNDGEVHCGTNAIRQTSGAAAWWEAL